MYKVFQKSSWDYHTHEHYEINHEVQFFDTSRQAYEYLLNLERKNKGFLDYNGTELYSNTDFYTLLLGSKAIEYGIAYVE